MDELRRCLIAEVRRKFRDAVCGLEFEDGPCMPRLRSRARFVSTPPHPVRIIFTSNHTIRRFRSVQTPDVNVLLSIRWLNGPAGLSSPRYRHKLALDVNLRHCDRYHL